MATVLQLLPISPLDSHLFTTAHRPASMTDAGPAHVVSLAIDTTLA